MRLRFHDDELMARLAPLALVALTASCGAPDPARSGAPGADGADVPVTLVDAAGTSHRLSGPARRVVSLVPSATATLKALGAADAIVGRTDYDTAAWISDLPSVGGGLEPNLEALIALRPDAVIRFEGDQDPRTPDRLDRLGIRHVAVRPVTLQDIYATNALLGVLTGRTASAESLSSAIRGELAEVAASVAGRVRQQVLPTLGGSPPWVAGPDTYVDALLTLAGADNVFTDLPAPWSAVSPEEIRSRRVDVVVVPSASTFDTTLTPGARVVEVGALLDLPGPDVGAAARRLARLIHRLDAG